MQFSWSSISFWLSGSEWKKASRKRICLVEQVQIACIPQVWYYSVLLWEVLCISRIHRGHSIREPITTITMEFGNGIYLPTEHLKSAQELVQHVSVHSRSNWKLAVLVFAERGKLEYPEKNLSEKGEDQQQTQPTYGAGTGNRTRATFVGGECSHHCATPAPILTHT